MKAVGFFEQRARERALREKLWRSVWIQAHAYDQDVCRGLGESEREDVFAAAVEQQTDLVRGEARALGFRGKAAWLREGVAP